MTNIPFAFFVNFATISGSKSGFWIGSWQSCIKVLAVSLTYEAMSDDNDAEVTWILGYVSRALRIWISLCDEIKILTTNSSSCRTQFRIERTSDRAPLSHSSRPSRTMNTFGDKYNEACRRLLSSCCVGVYVGSPKLCFILSAIWTVNWCLDSNCCIRLPIRLRGVRVTWSA